MSYTEPDAGTLGGSSKPEGMGGGNGVGGMGKAQRLKGRRRVLKDETLMPSANCRGTSVFLADK